MIDEVTAVESRPDPKCIIIGVAGGTGSGKSTFTNRIKKEFGDRVTVIYHDNYYRRQDGVPFEERTRVNYDHPDSLETDLLVRHLRELKHGRPVQCPVYDYTVHNRSDKTTAALPNKVILVEGILVLQDERLRDMMDIKIYVEADADERILRRALRRPSSPCIICTWNRHGLRRILSSTAAGMMWPLTWSGPRSCSCCQRRMADGYCSDRRHTGGHQGISL